MTQEPSGASWGRGRPLHAMAAIVAALLTALAQPGWAALPLASLQGRWVDEAGTTFAMTWSEADDGFTLRWTVPAGGEAEVGFRPSDRPGVFAGRARQGWSLFGRGKVANPLVEGTLYWARVADDVVYVYSLAVDDQGAFVLDRYACRLAADKLEVAFERRLPAGPGEEGRMLLTRAKG